MNLVLDFGGMSTKIAVMQNKEIIFITKYKYEKLIDIENLLNELTPILKEILFKYTIKNICLSVPGVVNSKTGWISGLAAIEKLDTINLVNYFEDIYKIKTYIENDANCASLAEIQFGNASNAKSASIIVIGTGIGGSLMLDKKIIKGSNLFAGEFGCLVEIFDQRRNQLTLVGDGGMYSLERKYFKKTGIKLSGFDIYNNYDNDTFCKKIIHTQIAIIAKLIVNIFFIFNPEITLLGGGISENKLFITLIRKDIEILMKKIGIDSKIKLDSCKFHNNSNLIGASSLPTN